MSTLNRMLGSAIQVSSRRLYNQNANIKRDFISSILQSSVTKREAKDYLKKYDLKASKKNIALFLLQDAQLLAQNHAILKKTLQKLNNLGVLPILVLQQTETSNKDLNLLEHYRISDLLDCTSIPNLDYIPESYKPTLYNNKGQRMLLYAINGGYTEDSKTKFVQFVKALNTKLGSLEKVIILNRNGGIPAKSRNWYPHVHLNLRDEYGRCLSEMSDKINSLDAESDAGIQETAKLKRDIYNMSLFRDCLNELPLTSTGLVTSYKSLNDNIKNNINNPVIHNLLTDRSLVSCSLPAFKKMQLFSDSKEKWYESSDLSIANENKEEQNDEFSKQTAEDVFFQTTVLKRGIDIRFFKERSLTENNTIGLPNKFHTGKKTPHDGFKLDLKKISSIIKHSFNKDLDLEHYLSRINGNLAVIIIIGDYEGIAICTYEGYKDGKQNEKELVYLDKIAVLPHLKGSLSIADLMFNEMFNQTDLLVWRSRKENVVNKWYFQRSKGSIDLDKIGKEADSIFRLFYYYNKEECDIFRKGDVKEVRAICEKIRDIKPSWKK